MTDPGLERAQQVWRARNPGAGPELTARADELLASLRSLGRVQWVLDYEAHERGGIRENHGAE